MKSLELAAKTDLKDVRSRRTLLNPRLHAALSDYTKYITVISSFENTLSGMAFHKMMVQDHKKRGYPILALPTARIEESIRVEVDYERKYVTEMQTLVELINQDLSEFELKPNQILVLQEVLNIYCYGRNRKAQSI